MIVVSIGDIIALIMGGIGLVVIGVAYIIYRIGMHQEKKYEIAIGEYDEELNQKNKSIAIGQSKTADMRGKE